MPIGKKNFFAQDDHDTLINWKSADLLRRYTTRFGSIKPRKYTWTGVKHQKMLRQSIIRARELGLLPYSR
jgi:ribosomal protein S18